MRFVLSAALFLSLLATAIQGVPHTTRSDVQDVNEYVTPGAVAALNIATGHALNKPQKRRFLGDIADPRQPKRREDAFLGEHDPLIAFSSGSKSPRAGGSGRGSGRGSGKGSGKKGSSMGDENSDKAAEKGKARIKALEDTIKDNLADSGDKSNLESAALGYKTSNKEGAPYDVDVPNPLKEFKITQEVGTNTNWQKRTIFRVDGTGSSETDPIVLSYQDVVQGAMVVKASYNKKLDPTAKAKWSQMIMDNLRTAAEEIIKEKGEDGTMKLDGEQVTAADLVKRWKYIFRDNIQDETTTSASTGITLDTPKAIDAVFAKLKVATTKTLTLDANSQDPDVIVSYDFMAAQTHVDRVLLVLKDYSQELGGLKISKLHLHHMDNPVTGVYDIIIELGH